MGKKKKRSKAGSIANLKTEASPDANHVQVEQRDEEKYSVDDLLDRVAVYVENFEFELAMKFCEKAVSLEPTNVNILETCGNVCSEMGDLQNAKRYFHRAIELERDTGHVKYLYLGQISEGEEAVKYYETALRIMKHAMEYDKNNIATSNSTINPLTKEAICSVYCSLAELYMTDCCMSNGAEKQCETYCNEALKADENNLEAHIVMCNFLLSSSDLETAKTAVVKAFELWKKTSELHEGNIAECMAYETRITLIKILLETECYENVSLIVDQLIEENEDDMRIWYYIGLAKSLLNTDDNPRFYLEKALELFEVTACEDHDMLQHVKELLENCPPEEVMSAIYEEDEEESKQEEKANCMDVEE